MNQQFSPVLHSIDGSCGCRHEGSLDAAWAEAEAAMPEGWEHLAVKRRIAYVDEPRCYVAEAGVFDDSVGEDGWSGEHSTPAAALRALTAKLRESVTRTVTDAVDRVDQSEPE